MTLVLTLLAALAALALLTWAHVVFWTQRLSRPLRGGTRLEVLTDDGARLALWHYPGTGSPVICCHGVACNSRSFDLDAETSLARDLSARGFDVYVLDLRGGGHSFVESPGAIGFFDYARRDAPAAVAFVQTRTGRRPFWVGHSMGGLIGYEVAVAAAESLAGLVAIGSPIKLQNLRGALVTGARLVPTLSLLSRPLGGRLPVSFISRVLAPLAGRRPLWPQTLFFGPSSIRGSVIRRFLVDGVHAVPSAVLSELARRMVADESLDGRSMSLLREALSSLTLPTMSIMGAVDLIAPIVACDVTEHRQGRDHEAVVMSIATGAPVDFGHLDLLFGTHASTHVHPRLAAWLADRAGLCESAAP